MGKIDIKSWNRKQTYLFFRNMDMPRYMLTVDLDITNFLAYIKSKKISFYLSFIYILMNEINQIENFRYRIIDGEVYLFDQTHPSFTDSIKNTELFKMVTADLEPELEKFIEEAQKKSIDQGDTFIDLISEKRYDLVYITSFPWAKYTQVSHAFNMNKEDSVPKLSWGKYENENGRIKIPISIEVHHALVDGIHVGTFIQNVQNKLNTY